MANTNSPDNEELKTARAQARFVRMTPMKARRVIDLVRGRSAAEALTILRFAPQAAAEPVAKVIASAVANAENNYSMDRDTLFIQTAFVDEGPTMKRFQPRAQGRAFRIRKRTCHITVVVASVDISANTATASRARRAESSSKAAYSKGKAS